MRGWTRFLLLAVLPGCGPLFVPMTPRLTADEQQGVDRMWDNLLTPVGRVDRQTLLDANLSYWMFAIGVDRLHLSSEKYFAGGKVEMTADCDRANPDADQFTVTVLDERGRTLRRERYSRADVEESARILRGISNLGPSDLRDLRVNVNAEVRIGEPVTRPTTSPATAPAIPETEPADGGAALTPELRRLAAEMARRQAAAAAATQPARLIPYRADPG